MNKPTTANELFGVIRKFFVNAEGEECCKAWDVLSALRGPDEGLPEGARKLHKKSMTCIIRTALLGWPGSSEIPVDFADDDEEYTKHRVVAAPGHFVAHAKQAFKALGLDWENVNAIPNDGVKL